MNEQKLRWLFNGQSDCYTDTGRFDDDGRKIFIQAMTEDRFIEVLNKINMIDYEIAGAIPYSALSDSFKKSIDSIEESLYILEKAKNVRMCKDRSIGLNADD